MDSIAIKIIHKNWSMMNKISSYPLVLITLSLLSAVTLTLVSQGERVDGGKVLANVPTVQPNLNTQQRVIYVDPKRGNDSVSAGQSEANALRTITAALERSQAGTVIQLAPGRYHAGEVFPLKLQPGVILRGDESGRGDGVVITGGNTHLSRIWAGQNITILAGESSQILGVTVTNPNPYGTGVWIENANAIVKNSTFTNNNREGIFVSGTAQPIIENNQFMYNGGNGISVTKESKGEIRRNVFQDTGFALAIGHNAAPVVAGNHIHQNRIGIVVTQAARPILEGNIIENNSDYGLVAIAESQPQIAASNTFRGNERENQLIARNPQGIPPTPDEPSGVQRAYFTCEPYGTNYATVAQQGYASIPQAMIVWKSSEVDLPENRCNEVTQKLNQKVTAYGGQLHKMLFATGRVNNDRVICLVKDLQDSCQPDNMLFTLSGFNASDPTQVLRQLIAFSVEGKGNPVQEFGEEAIAPLESVAHNLQPALGLWFVRGLTQ